MEKEKLDPNEDEMSDKNSTALRNDLDVQTEIEYDTSEEEEDECTNTRSNQTIIDSYDK